MNAPAKTAYGLRDGRLVHVSEVPRGLACGCACPACGAALLARKGKVRVHHFAHSNSAICQGAAETVLHLLAKELFLELDTFEIPPYHFKKRRMLKTGDEVVHEEQLLKGGTVRIDRVVLEANKGAFTPDVEIISGPKTLMVEIAVTHKVDDAKLKRIRRHDVPALEIRLSVDDALLSRDEFRERLQNGLKDKHWLFHPKQRGAERRFLEKYRARVRTRNTQGGYGRRGASSSTARRQSRGAVSQSMRSTADWGTYDRLGEQFRQKYGRYPSLEEAIERWPWLFNPPKDPR